MNKWGWAAALWLGCWPAASGAQDVRMMMELFGGFMQDAAKHAVLTEWQKLPPQELQCLQTVFQRDGRGIEQAIRQGMFPNHPAVAAARLECRQVQLRNEPAPFESVPNQRRDNPPAFENAQDRGETVYIVDKIKLGDKFAFAKDYDCGPSEQFAGQTWCQRKREDRNPQGRVSFNNSVVHASDGTVVYVNQGVEPSVMTDTEARAEIQRLSARFRETPRIIDAPAGADTSGLIAVWGDLRLEPLDTTALADLAARGRGPGRGFMVDHLGSFRRSAREGSPVYLVSGGRGYVWSAHYDANGRGALRFFAINAAYIADAIAAKNENRFMPVPQEWQKQREIAQREKEMQEREQRRREELRREEEARRQEEERKRAELRREEELRRQEEQRRREAMLRQQEEERRAEQRRREEEQRRLEDERKRREDALREEIRKQLQREREEAELRERIRKELEAEQRREAERKATERHAEEQRRVEEQRRAEELRLAEVHRLAEVQRREEEQRRADQQRQTEQARLEEQRQAEKRRVEEEARRAEEEHLRKALPEPGPSGNRFALVIGNDAYPNLGDAQQLRKALNDARAIGAVLERIGFTVVRGENLSRAGIVEKVSELSRRVRPGDTVFFFFAGHGVAMDGANYLLPSDISAFHPGDEAKLRRLAMSEAELAEDLVGTKARVAILVIDACRNNPFGRAGGTRSLGKARGLNRSSIEAHGTFIVYSAGIGQEAVESLGPDDDSPNSIFTRVLVPQLARPNVHLGDVVVDIREQVAALAAETGREQNPAFYDQTRGGRIYLVPGKAEPAVLPPPKNSDAPGMDETAWSFIRGTRDITQLRRFLREFPNSPRAVEARNALQSLEAVD